MKIASNKFTTESLVRKPPTLKEKRLLIIEQPLQKVPKNMECSSYEIPRLTDVSRAGNSYHFYCSNGLLTIFYLSQSLSISSPTSLLLMEKLFVSKDTQRDSSLLRWLHLKNKGFEKSKP